MNDQPSAVPGPATGPAAPPRSVRINLKSSAPTVTYTLLGVTIAVYLLQWASVWLLGYANSNAQLDWLEAYGARINELIRLGQIWRFLTPALLHASVPHILFNMYALFTIGTGLERFFGHWRYLTLYVLGAFTGNVASFLLSSGYSVGASTAIFALVGAEGIFLYQNRTLFGKQFGPAITNVVVVVLANLYLGLTSPGIDNWGHVGGLLGGLLFAWFAAPRWEVQGTYPDLHLADRREPREILTGTALVVLIFGLLAMWGMFHPIAP